MLTQALESSLGDWYERAMLASGVNPVGDPKLDLSDLPEEGKPLRFSIEVAVRPSAELGEYKGLEVGRAEPEVPEEAVETEINRLREGFARLNPVERAAKEGDVVLIDYEGKIDGEPFEGGTAHDYLLELGEGRVLPELEQGLEGAEPGDERQVSVPFPDDYPAEEVAGKTAEFDVKVKEVREKELPELDDDFASEASEFDTLAELRDDISEKIRRDPRQPDRRALPRGRTRCRCRQGDGRSPRPGHPGEGRGDVAAGGAPAAPAGNGAGELSPGPGQDCASR